MIGIYGGSFDPVHLGHLQTATSIKNELSIDRLFMLPCFEPVHKNSLNYTSKKRLQMLNLAIKEFTSLEIDTREILRGGSSFMIDTLLDLKESFKDESICLIIGMDSFINFKTWKNWDEFSKLTHIAVLPRNGNQPISKTLETFDTAKNADQLKAKPNGYLYFSNSQMIDISSSDIRGKIAANQNLDNFLPTSIISFIKKYDT
jgi:nicotinate-nucleotide adenylyltransferase